MHTCGLNIWQRMEHPSGVISKTDKYPVAFILAYDNLSKSKSFSEGSGRGNNYFFSVIKRGSLGVLAASMQQMNPRTAIYVKLYSLHVSLEQAICISSWKSLDCDFVDRHTWGMTKTEEAKTGWGRSLISLSPRYYFAFLYSVSFLFWWNRISV